MAIPSTKDTLGFIYNSGKNLLIQGKQKASDLLSKDTLFSNKSSFELKNLSKKGSYKGVEGGDVFDVVNNYPWTLSDKANRQNVPFIQLTEYEQDVATLYAQLAYWTSNLKPSDVGRSINPYENLYHALPTGAIFILPYFEDYDHQIGQSWEKTKGIADYAIADKVLQIAGNIAKALQLAPGTTVNQPQVWKGPSNANTYTINFKLFNTNNADDITRNMTLKRRLQMSTLHDQRTAILSSPPAIFEVNIPGIRYSPAAVISQLNVNNIGQINLIKGENVPDAYEFNIQILELITESRQILDASVTGDHTKVRAITKIPPPTIGPSMNNPSGPPINAAGQAVNSAGTKEVWRGP